MNLEPPAERVEQYREHFPGLHLGLVIASIVAGNTRGELWVHENREAGPVVLLWDRGNNVLYLSGDVQSPLSLDALSATITEHVRPRALEAGSPRFKVRALSPSLDAHLVALFSSTTLHRSGVLFLVHDQTGATASAVPSLTGCTLRPITRDLLTDGTVGSTGEVREEIGSMWPCEQRFFEHGLGVVAVLDGSVICWCTAEYVSEGMCGIGIATVPRFEGQGVATATAAEFVRRARARGITPYWQCAATNRGSVRVAEKVGFVELSAETYWTRHFGS